MTRPRLVAEVKTKSPFGYRAEWSRQFPKPAQATAGWQGDDGLWESLLELANQRGDWVAVHTDSRWGGSWRRLHTARDLTQKPLLAKGVHPVDDDIRRALDLGADAVLVVGRTAIDERLKDRVWFEPLHPVELRRWDKGLAVVWNRRDLQTGGLPRTLGSQARLTMVDYDWTLASGLTGWDVVPAGVPSILVGEHLPAFTVLPWAPPQDPPRCQAILEASMFPPPRCNRGLLRTRRGWQHTGGGDPHPGRPVVHPDHA
jgi:hypothetical protein